MIQNNSPRRKMHRLQFQDEGQIKNPNLVKIIDQYKDKKSKNRALMQHAGNHLNSSYKHFLERQKHYKINIQQTDERISQMKNNESKENRQTSIIKEKKRINIKNNKKELEEIEEKNRMELYQKQQDKLQRYSQLHQSMISDSFFIRSHSNAESSLKIKTQKQKNQQLFSNEVMKSSKVKLQRINQYIKHKSLIQSQYVGTKDRSVDLVLERNISLQSKKLKDLIQKYLVSKNVQEKNHSQYKEKVQQKYNKMGRDYEKRKIKANQKKEEYMEQKIDHINNQFQSSVKKFGKVDAKRRSMEVSWNKHIQENRRKIQKILHQNDIRKSQDRQRKERFVENYKQKIKDIDRFRKQFDRIKLQISPTFLTS